MAREIQLLRTLLFAAGIAGARTGWYGCAKRCERLGYDSREFYCRNGCCYRELL